MSTEAFKNLSDNLNETVRYIQESRGISDYYKNVIDTLKERTSATTNALEGMKVVEIIERIYKVRNEQLNF
jgi:hypothetical protein